MTTPDDRRLEHLLRLPWTIVREVTPEGDSILRVAEIPSAAGSGATKAEMEADLWESLKESLRAYLHFDDQVPVPAGREPYWAGSSRALARTPFIVRVPDAPLTATAAALSSSPEKHAA